MDTKAVPLEEAESRLRELLSLADSGTDVVLLDGDKPVGRLVSLRPRQAGLHAGAVAMGEDFDAPLPDDFWTGGK